MRDADDADWLHEALEEFTCPARAGRQADRRWGRCPSRLTPIFRDRQELAAAGDLGAEIRRGDRRVALPDRALLARCGASRWTNEEIASFKRLHPRRLASLPRSSMANHSPATMPGREAEECFPPALRIHFDRRGRPTDKRAEPIAADLREGRDGRSMGLLKIVAGMLGVGLDDLVQRESQRRQPPPNAHAAASVAGMLVTSGLAVTAIEARDAARDQRREAEGLIGFMLGDLRDKLEPIGRLDALDACRRAGARHITKARTSRELSDAALAQRSRALTLMGEIAKLRGDLDGALAPIPGSDGRHSAKWSAARPTIHSACSIMRRTSSGSAIDRPAARPDRARRGGLPRISAARRTE